MVEATSRGEVPPSTMMEMRSCNWSRTASAVVHSDAPLKFAEVAVMGILAAITTASGILELGTRNATFPVFVEECVRVLHEKPEANRAHLVLELKLHV